MGDNLMADPKISARARHDSLLVGRPPKNATSVNEFQPYVKKHTIRCLTPHVRSLQMAVVAKHDSLFGIFTSGTEPDGVPPCICHKTVERRFFVSKYTYFYI